MPKFAAVLTAMFEIDAPDVKTADEIARKSLKAMGERAGAMRMKPEDAELVTYSVKRIREYIETVPVHRPCAGGVCSVDGTMVCEFHEAFPDYD